MTKKSDDIELQKLIFESLTENEPRVYSEDGEYYKIIKDALESEPDAMLPADFAELVTLKAVRKKKIFELYRTSLLYLGSFSLIVAASCFAFYFLAKDVFYYLINGVQNFKYPILFALLIFGLVQIVDELWVHRKLTKPKD